MHFATVLKCNDHRRRNRVGRGPQIFDRVGRPCIWPTRNFSTCLKIISLQSHMEAIRTSVIVPFRVTMLNGNGFQIVWPIGLFYAKMSTNGSRVWITGLIIL